MGKTVEWREICGFPGYEVNSSGDIRLTTGEAVKPSIDKRGYVNLTIIRKVRVHRAVLMAFVGPPPTGKPLVRHLDGNPQNNQVTNLAWGSQAENTQDAIKHGTHPWLNPTRARVQIVRPNSQGEKNTNSKLTAAEARQIRARAKKERLIDIAKDFPHISLTTVGKISRGEMWKHLDVPPIQKQQRKGGGS